MQVRNIVLGLGAFAGSVAALAVGAVALTSRRADAGQGAPASDGESSLPASGSTAGSATTADNGPTARPQPAPTGDEGHAVPDLAAGQDLGPTHRAPEAFRPNMDAPMTAAEREALRPATGPSPSLVSDEGAGVQGPGGDLR